MTNNNYYMKNFYNQIMKGKPMLYGYQFIVEFINGGTMDGGGVQFDLFNHDPSNPEENFTYYAQSASLPSFEVVKASVNYYGNNFRVPTVIKYEHDWTVTILLEQDMIMYEKLRRWMQMISDLRMNGGRI